ncbi:MAG: PorT family protein [Bacteroidales bacterium]|nr:PorT family protein [Bacteroidales bacterium]
MKNKRLSILLLVLVLISCSGYGQRIKGAVIAGMNLSQVDGDYAYGFNKIGLNAGAAAIVPFGKNFSFTLETLFSQKGSYQSKQYEETITDSLGNVIANLNGQYKLYLDYLEVPFLVHYTDKDIISAGVGFSYGRLVNVKEYEHGTLNSNTSLNSGTYDLNDYSVLVDLKFRLHKKISRFKFNIRYSYSMRKIRTRDFYNEYGEYTESRDQYNNVISFRLIYVFNERAKLADLK